MMRNNLFFLIVSFLLFGCGTIAVSPRGCVSTAQFADDKKEMATSKLVSVNGFLEDDTVFYKDLINCETVSEVRLKMKKRLFFNYHVTLDFKEE